MATLPSVWNHSGESTRSEKCGAESVSRPSFFQKDRLSQAACTSAGMLPSRRSRHPVIEPDLNVADSRAWMPSLDRGKDRILDGRDWHLFARGCRAMKSKEFDGWGNLCGDHVSCLQYPRELCKAKTVRETF